MMRVSNLYERTIWFLIGMFAVSSIVIIPVAGQDFKRIIQDASWENVKAELYECRRNEGILTIKILLRNEGNKKVSGGSFLKENRITYQDIYVVDSKAKKKYFTLKHKDRGYLAGPLGYPDGRWWPEIPPNSAVPIWAKLAAPPSTVTKVDVSAPGMPPFEDVPIKEGILPVNPAGAVIQVGETHWRGVSADLTKAQRRGDELSVEVLLKNNTSKKISGGNFLHESRIDYNYVFLLDPKSFAKYGVKKDAEGKYLAGPLESKERWWVQIPENGSAKIWIKFLAPPTEVSSVDIYVPGILPFENIPLTGVGGGTGAAGGALEAKAIGIEGILGELGAKVTENEILIQLSSDVLFDFDKADILPKAQDSLKKVAQVIREKAKGAVRVEGHTDSKGSDAYNQKLSDRRANAVKDWLVNKEALKNVKFETVGFGSKKPVAHNTKPDGSDDPEGRQKNRRVEIVVKK